MELWKWRSSSLQSTSITQSGESMNGFSLPLPHLPTVSRMPSSSFTCISAETKIPLWLMHHIKGNVGMIKTWKLLLRGIWIYWVGVMYVMIHRLGDDVDLNGARWSPDMDSSRTKLAPFLPSHPICGETYLLCKSWTVPDTVTRTWAPRYPSRFLKTEQEVQ